MSAAPGRPKQARTTARQSEGYLMSAAGPFPRATTAMRSMEVT